MINALSPHGEITTTDRPGDDLSKQRTAPKAKRAILRFGQGTEQMKTEQMKIVPPFRVYFCEQRREHPRGSLFALRTFGGQMAFLIQPGEMICCWGSFQLA